MSIVKHELKRGFVPFLIWTLGIAGMIAVCIFLFPEMKKQMEDVNDMFASMGSFTTAFGMDRLNFGTLLGFYSVECGNILGLGGALYAAFIGISYLSKEEKDRTAEFLLAHPISRVRILSEKLLAMCIQVTMLNVLCLATSIACMIYVKEEIPWKEILLIHGAFYILQIEISCICFGLSAYLRKGSVGIGLALAMIMYFLNIVYNITDKVDFLKYVTPFRYCEAADIIETGSLDFQLIGIGLTCAVLCILLAFIHYSRKDIYA